MSFFSIPGLMMDDELFSRRHDAGCCSLWEASKPTPERDLPSGDVWRCELSQICRQDAAGRGHIGVSWFAYPKGLE